MNPLMIFVLLVYLSLILEITLFSIPSEASTYQIFFRDGASEDNSALAQARRHTPWHKVVLYLVPTALGVLLFAVPLWLVFFPAALNFLVPLPALSQPVIRAVGIGVVVIGRLVTFTSVLQLRRRRHTEQYELQPAGWFARSRNPGLVGMYLFYLGIALIFPCLVLVVGFLPYFLNMTHRVRMEESFLEQRLGDAYVRYRDSVPRYWSWARPEPRT